MKERLPLFPDFNDEKKAGMSSNFLKRVAKNFKQTKHKSLFLKSQRHLRDILPIPPPEKAFEPKQPLPRPFNKAPFLGQDKNLLLRWAEQIENLPATLLIYHGTQQLLTNNPDIENDFMTHFYRCLRPQDIRHFLHGVGILKAPEIIPSPLDLNLSESILPDRKTLQYHITTLRASLSGFVEAVISQSEKTQQFSEEFGHDLSWNYQDRVLLLETYRRDMLDRFTKYVPFHTQKSAMDTTSSFFRDNSHISEKQHPGKHYMNSVIKYLKARQVNHKKSIST